MPATLTGRGAVPRMAPPVPVNPGIAADLAAPPSPPAAPTRRRRTPGSHYMHRRSARVAGQWQLLAASQASQGRAAKHGPTGSRRLKGSVHRVAPDMISHAMAARCWSFGGATGGQPMLTRSTTAVRFADPEAAILPRRPGWGQRAVCALGDSSERQRVGIGLLSAEQRTPRSRPRSPCVLPPRARSCPPFLVQLEADAIDLARALR